MEQRTRSSAVPRLRFPAFRGADKWEERLLGNEGEFLSSLTGKSAQHFGVGSAKYITYMNVFSNTFTDSRTLGTVDVAADESQTRVQAGDVLFTVSSETPDEAGMSSVVLDSIPDCYLNSFCTIFRFAKAKRPNLRFLGYLLRQPVVRKHLAQRAQGSTRFNLSKGAFRSLPFAIPSPSEQQKIADCLTSLDELIAAQAHKIQSLTLYKRGLIQQLFPRQGESLPRRRFPEFTTSSWHQQKLGSLLSKASHPVDVEPDSMYREIGIRSHGKGIFHKEPVRGRVLGEKRVFHVVQNALVLNIVFAWEQAVATTSKSELGMIASHRFPMYVAKPGKCNVEYVKQFFLTKTGKELLGIASPGGAGRNKTLGQRDFENLLIPLSTSVAEQTRIAECVASLDTEIGAELCKLEALNAHKNGLMQQLFPAPKEA